LLTETILRTPGPTPVPLRVQQAMAQPMLGHRSGEFSELFHETAQRLKPIFGTEQDVFIVTGSGTSVLEMAVVNTIEPGDEVVVVVTGAFGDRFAAICERYGADTHRLDIEWGQACTEDVLAEYLQRYPDVKAVFATYCETSTGVLNPVDRFADVVRSYSEALFIVDGVSCIGGVPAKMDEWGIDILVTGSQKALMLPPGLAFISASERAWNVIEHNQTPSFYLNLPAYRDQYKKKMTPYTPAVSLIFGLAEVCSMLEEEGLQEVVKRHETMKEMTRAAMKALGLPLLTDDDDASPTVTSVAAKDGVQPDELRKVLRNESGITLAGGQKKLKGEIFRIAHMGYCFPADIITVVSAIETALQKSGHDVSMGTGVRAAQEVTLENVSRFSK
jgi:aspartate aminotransferase-like enzyme